MGDYFPLVEKTFSAYYMVVSGVGSKAILLIEMPQDDKRYLFVGRDRSKQ